MSRAAGPCVLCGLRLLAAVLALSCSLAQHRGTSLQPAHEDFREKDCGLSFSRDVGRARERGEIFSAFDVPVWHLKDLSY